MRLVPVVGPADGVAGPDRDRAGREAERALRAAVEDRHRRRARGADQGRGVGGGRRSRSAGSAGVVGAGGGVRSALACRRRAGAGRQRVPAAAPGSWRAPQSPWLGRTSRRLAPELGRRPAPPGSPHRPSAGRRRSGACSPWFARSPSIRRRLRGCGSMRTPALPLTRAYGPEPSQVHPRVAASRLRWVRISLRIRSSRGSVEESTWRHRRGDRGVHGGDPLVHRLGDGAVGGVALAARAQLASGASPRAR